MPADTKPVIPRPSSSDVRVIYLTRAGCHLCDVALPIVRAEADRAGCAVDVIDIDDDDALRESWSFDVPVVIVDGQVFARYEVDREALRTKLTTPRWKRIFSR